MDVCGMLLTGKLGTAVVPLLAACLAVAAWLGKSYVSGFLHYFARYSDEVEMLSALKAEIAIIVDHVDGQDGRVADLRAIYDKDPGHKLFMPLYRDTIVFEALKNDVTAITERSLKKVIAFYNLSGALDALQTSMTSDRFETLSTERRIKVFERFLDTAKVTSDAGREAIATIDSELSIVRTRRAFISLVSTGLVVLVVIAGAEAVQSVTSCFAEKRIQTGVAADVSGLAMLFGSDERGQDRSHVTPRMRLVGANDNSKPHIAVIVPSFNPTSAFERPSISGGRYVAA